MQTRQNNYEKKNDNQDAVALIKTIVKETLEALNDIDIQIEQLKQKKYSLRRDIIDLKEGRLDRIEERHNMDKESQEHSVFHVEKKVVINGEEKNQWYIPYYITLKNNGQKSEITINNSITKAQASGTYKMSSGEIKFL